MCSRIRRAALMGLVIVMACARLNPSFGEGEADGGTDGDTAGSTVGQTRGSDSGAASDTRDSDSSSPDTVGSMSETNSTTGGSTTGGDTSGVRDETGLDTEGVEACVVIPGPNGFCDTLGESCPGATCAPWSSEVGGDLEGTFCLPAGTLMDGDECEPICTGDFEQNCGPDLVCDVYSSSPAQCRPTCAGLSDLVCATGICLLYAWEEKKRPKTVTPLSLCKGECDPAEFDLANTCEKGEVCVLDEGAGTACVAEGSPVSIGGDCTENACARGLICVPTDTAPECEHDACCYEACSFASPVCPAGNCMINLDVPFADSISVGYCPPP